VSDIKARVTLEKWDGMGLLACVLRVHSGDRVALGGGPDPDSAKANAYAFLRAIERGIDEAEPPRENW
jgi:hypothetical protein